MNGAKSFDPPPPKKNKLPFLGDRGFLDFFHIYAVIENWACRTYFLCASNFRWKYPLGIFLKEILC